MICSYFFKLYTSKRLKNSILKGEILIESSMYIVKLTISVKLNLIQNIIGELCPVREFNLIPVCKSLILIKFTCTCYLSITKIDNTCYKIVLTNNSDL